jgi:hypothetical protein
LSDLYNNHPPIELGDPMGEAEELVPEVTEQDILTHKQKKKARKERRLKKRNYFE